MAYSTSTRPLFLIVVVALVMQVCTCFTIYIINSTDTLEVTDSEGQVMPQFQAAPVGISCSMPKLYIYNDTSHEQYTIQTQGVSVASIQGKYRPVHYETDCYSCPVLIDNGCSDPGKN